MCGSYRNSLFPYQFSKHTEIKISDTHKHNNTITHTQTQQHKKDDLHRDNQGPEGGKKLREAEREPQQSKVWFKRKNQVQTSIFIWPDTRPEPENKTRNPTQIFSNPPKTYWVGFSGGPGPCLVLLLQKTSCSIKNNHWMGLDVLNINFISSIPNCPTNQCPSF